MRVRLTTAAESDLGNIGDFIGRDNPTRAESFVDELLDRCEALGQHPERYPIHISRRGRGLRRCAYRRYLIFYVALPKEVEIVRVIHSARDYMRLLYPED